MATFNGAKYLLNQLESIDKQSRLPDEMVVCDDASSDETVEILKLFAIRARFHVRIILNETRLGFVKNFEKSISLCTGDVIFLSDQDDVWYPNKISTVVSKFLAQPGNHVFIHDQDIVSSDLVPKNKTTFSNCRRLGLSLNWVVTGCCTAFSREFRDFMLPFPNEITSHDGWIHRLALLLSMREVIPISLQLYRRHDENSSHSLAVSDTMFPKLHAFMQQSLNKVPGSWRREILISSAAISVISDRALLALNVDSRLVERVVIRETKKINLLNARVLISDLPWYRRISSVVRVRMDHRTSYSWKKIIKDIFL